MPVQSIDQLIEVSESRSFKVCWTRRNPNAGRGMGPAGVRDDLIVQWYLEGLEASYRALTQMGWTQPRVGSGGKTLVFVSELSELFGVDSPFTSSDMMGVPFIGLASRTNEPTLAAAQWRAVADAAHEATHVLNASYRPFLDVYSVPWIWFNEGTAVFMESQTSAGNPDSLRFAMDWSDCPEVPLDSEIAWYQAGLFVRYLHQRFGPTVLSRVWRESDVRESPSTTMDRILQEQPGGLRFASPDPNITDVFGAGYCVDSYFVRGFAPEVFERYGGRAVSESFELGSQERVGVKGRDTLDHLACRYYRFFPRQGTKRIQVVLHSFPPDELSRLRAELVIVGPNFTRGPSIRMQPAPANPVENSFRLEADLSPFDPSSVDHAVLVVANCGWGTAKNRAGTPVDDAQEYSIQATAD